MKRSAFFFNLIALSPILCGCSRVGERVSGQAVLYGAMAALAVLLFLGCIPLLKKRELWMTGLFGAISVVNCGYFLLAISKTLEQALWANRLAYLGSVFLPMMMLMAMLRVCKIRGPKWLPFSLLGVCIVIFFIAASPGWLPIYYKEVSLVIEGGVASLKKEYGPLHILYLFYLLSHFASLIAAMIYAGRKKKLESSAHAAILAVAVFVNIGVWLLEQLIKIDFEILSISYIISELFLLGLYFMIQENERRLQQALAERERAPEGEANAAKLAAFEKGIASLTKTERAVFDLYCQGKNTLFVLEALSIKENTLKYHNRNLYAKLGISSRKELRALAEQLQK